MPQLPLPTSTSPELDRFNFVLDDFESSQFKIFEPMGAIESNYRLGRFNADQQIAAATPSTWPTAASIQVLTDAAYSLPTTFMNLVIPKTDFKPLLNAVTAGQQLRPDSCVLVSAALSMGASSQKYIDHTEFQSAFTADSLLSKSFSHFELLGRQCDVDYLLVSGLLSCTNLVANFYSV